MRPSGLLFAMLLVCALPCAAQKRPPKSPQPQPPPVAAPDTPAQPESAAGSESQGWYWGGCLSIEMGGMVLLGDGLDAIQDAGLGTLGRDSLTALFTLGTSIRRPGAVDFSLLASYLVGGSYVWEDVLSDIGYAARFYGGSLAVQAEVRPLFAFLHGFQPFVGAGYSITNGLTQENGVGFRGGRGPFVVGGLCVANSFGIPWFPLRDEGKWYFALRISAYYRLPFALAFDQDWNAYASVYTGSVPLEQVREFFEGRDFEASSFALGVGVELGFSPLRLGRPRT